MTKSAAFDDPKLSMAYSDLRGREGRPNEMVETPALQDLLPNLAGLRIVDLGCGAGHMARWASAGGASSVLAFDASENMIQKARLDSVGHAIEYTVTAIEELGLPADSADVVMSGLALHYVSDIEGLFLRIHDWLAPGGQLAFSVEHPIMTCASRRWFQDESGARLHWPVDHYLIEGDRKVEWLGAEVERVHRSVSSYAEALLKSGFRIVALREPAPTPDQIERWPALRDHLRRPPFLLFSVRKSA